MSERTKAPTWRALLAAGTQRLGDAADARRIAEEASGWEGAELILNVDEETEPLTYARWSAMVDRRAGGEPLQYVLGRWGFRSLDLFVDGRVLIPRPETEEVVSHALAELDRLDGKVVVDLGTGSGAIALAVAVERKGVEVWATDASVDAIEVARANLAGAGRAAARVRLAAGSWFSPLPSELRGAIDLVVANPPYVATGEQLPAEVAEWEPVTALVAGPTGLEAIEAVVAEAAVWLRRPGALVVEIGETQSAAALALARQEGFAEAETRVDAAGRDRVLVARVS
ncbi:MAG: release factor glutamine methyltransferase [Acidimicrobiaceae bacterium]